MTTVTYGKVHGDHIYEDHLGRGITSEKGLKMMKNRPQHSKSEEDGHPRHR